MSRACKTTSFLGIHGRGAFVSSSWHCLRRVNLLRPPKASTVAVGGFIEVEDVDEQQEIFWRPARVLKIPCSKYSKPANSLAYGLYNAQSIRSTAAWVGVATRAPQAPNETFPLTPSGAPQPSARRMAGEPQFDLATFSPACRGIAIGCSTRVFARPLGIHCRHSRASGALLHSAHVFSAEH